MPCSYILDCSRSANFRFSLDLHTPAKPINPVPSRAKDDGSGTVPNVVPCPVRFVSPEERRVDPVKKPLPTFTVNTTVAPCTVAPVGTHVPLKTPVNV